MSNALLFSGDAQVVRAISGLLESMAEGVHTLDDPERARHLLTSTRHSIAVVDCETPGALELLHVIRQGLRHQERRRRGMKLVAVIGEQMDMRTVSRSGATFVVSKPVETPSSMRALRMCLATNQRERRTLVRQPLTVDVTLNITGGGHYLVVRGIVTDINTSGLSILTLEQVPVTKNGTARFVLPAIGKPGPVQIQRHVSASVEVIWSDAIGRAGLLFRDLPRLYRDAIRLYAESSLEPDQRRRVSVENEAQEMNQSRSV